MYIFDQIEKLDIEMVVAGHGEIGMLKTINGAVMPARYASLGVPSVFYGNVRALLQKREQQTG